MPFVTYGGALMYNYRDLRLNNLCSDRFKHLLLLLYWPLYGIMFGAVERLIIFDSYHTMYHPLDDVVPFCEWFLFPYLFWFVFMVGMLFYTAFWDVKSFKKYMWFIIITYTATIIIYLVFPNQQELRVLDPGRSNALIDFIHWYYDFDTNTNVCPSLHVIGSIAVLYASWNSVHFKKWTLRIIMTVLTVLISISTVFLKQHSVLDIPPAVLLSVLAAPLATYLAKKF